MSQVICLVLSQSLWKQEGFSGCINVRVSAPLTIPDYRDFFLSLKAKPEHIFSILLFLSHSFQCDSLALHSLLKSLDDTTCQNITYWAFLVQQYLANSVSKINLRIWYLVFFVEINPYDNFWQFSKSANKLRCLMSQIYLLYRIHINHIKTEQETYLMEGVRAPLLPFAFGVTSVKKMFK